MPTPRALRPLVVLVGIAALVLAGCAPGKNQVTAPASSASASSSVPAQDYGDLADFYGQQLDWTTCDAGECSKVTVPLDYDDPSGPTISLAISRHAAEGTPIGSLLMNPGGPGASGIDFLESFLGEATSKLKKNYDLVGFDPRGIQRSAPITCVDPEEMDRIIALDPDTSTDAGLQAMIDESATFSKECVNRSGDVFGHVDTISAAKDLDIMRAALGDDQLHYLGFSYGTKLGATYAALFPKTAGRLVLDGALDPTLSEGEIESGQAGGFENALRAYVADCLKGSSCPLTGSVDDGMTQIRALLDRAKVNPLPTGTDRDLTQSLTFSGIAVTLYSQSYWAALTQGLAAAIHDNDGSILLSFADVYYDRDEDGTYSTNSTEAFRAVNCLDDRSDPDFDVMRAEAAQIQKVAPTVGSFFSYGATGCADWAVPEVGGLDDYSAKGAPPVLVVGTTNDPATPYAWAQSLAQTLTSGVLLTYEGEGHTAYRASNTCIAKVVDAYLVDGKVPDDGTRC
ncbi:alpha/beta hydrolase [Cellulomonas edaphi]|uniref:Alpha/beta hydrolase n=1 Tax=Cellulomonas edaphi TaxID=3053468 RepID=A0ABT7S438_9CELL|nr:alpha/beta hydrolase [Cellulomons edaphi]MDM7830388.1 alpha/beta hydrolase [Cellulomons edaphi]